MPPGMGIKLLQCRDESGNRFFSPAGSFGGFVVAAWCAGLALRIQQGELVRWEINEERRMWFFFLRSHTTQQYIRRSFNHIDDLLVRRAGRDIEGLRQILPWDTCEPRMPGSPFALLTLGEQAARAANVLHPSTKEKLRYGFLDVAKRVPLICSTEEIEALVRLALFDLGNGAAPSEAIQEEIRSRIDAALDKHWDDSILSFNNWYSGKHNSFVKQISKTGKNRIDPDHVRYVLQELAWEGYRRVTKNIASVMLEFAASLPEPLNQVEQGWFEHLLLPRDYFGGLPLALIAERLDFIQQAIWEIGSRPGEQGPVQVLHALLQFYASMIAARREADRQTKSRSSRRKARSRQDLSAMKHARRDDGHGSAPLEQLAEVAARYRILRGIRCECGSENLAGGIDQEGEESAHITFRCQDCRKSLHVSALITELT